MTAPTQDEDAVLAARLKRFLDVKPHHTGLVLRPDDQRTAILPWWFADESALERFEIRKHQLFCRACSGPVAPDGVYSVPLLVDYQKDPLGSLDGLATLHCPRCHDSHMVPVEKLTWPVNEEAQLGFTAYERENEIAVRVRAMQQLQQQAVMQGINPPYPYGGISQGVGQAGSLGGQQALQNVYGQMQAAKVHPATIGSRGKIYP
jgi:hypothetical protein